MEKKVILNHNMKKTEKRGMCWRRLHLGMGANPSDLTTQNSRFALVLVSFVAKRVRKSCFAFIILWNSCKSLIDRLNILDVETEIRTSPLCGKLKTKELDRSQLNNTGLQMRVGGHCWNLRKSWFLLQLAFERC